MKGHKTLHKPVGKTPLETVELFRLENPKLISEKLAYAGRLDPMARGKLLVLIGEECKKQEKYLRLDKEYEFKILLGFTSDTGDVLGHAEEISSTNISKEDLDIVVREMLGHISLEYPVYSSKTVDGKPLFLWALEEKLEEIEIPHAETEIYKIACLDIEDVKIETIKNRILEKIESISQVSEKSKALGRDFRRKEIIETWKEIFLNTKQETLQVATMRCICSSGTYIRSLAGELGKILQTGALAYEIERTQIGKYQRVFKGTGFWLKKY